MTNALAPIVIFAFNRPEHTKRALESLAKNPEFSESPVIVYCDGPRPGDDLAAIDATRATVADMLGTKARIVQRDENFGLANSISYGVSSACDEFGRVIVIEDDLVVSPAMLGYMNAALTTYADNPKIMHVSAYMFPVDIVLPQPTFLYREATCWGWGTWSEAWSHFNLDALESIKEIEKRGLVHEFNVSDTMFFMQMLRKQAAGEIDSWAIRWYASMFLNGGLALHPSKSFVENGGFDGSGVHSTNTNIFDVDMTNEWASEFSDHQEEDLMAVAAMMDFRGDRFLSGQKTWPKKFRKLTPPQRQSTGQPISWSSRPGQSAS